MCPVCRQALASLPEELLQRILALVPLYNVTRRRRAGGVPDLLQLRLVCRRWARSVLGAAVWRHRELDYNPKSGPMAGMAPRLLRHVPAVARLNCWAHDEKSLNDLRALANSPIQVRTLALEIHVTYASCLVTKRLLDKKHCEELRLTVCVHHVRNNPKSLLQHVDSLQGIKALTLAFWPMTPETEKQGPLQYAFQHLTGLTKLSLGRYLHVDTVRSMLEASKLTLRELDCGDYDVAHLASTASQLRCIRVAGDSISANLLHLRQLEHLDVLSLSLQYYHFWSPPKSERERSEMVGHFLNSSPLVPRQVHLTLHGFEALHHWNTTLMDRVTHLTIICEQLSFAGSEDSQCLAVPLGLPRVVKLVLCIPANMKPWWQGLRAAWRNSTAPNLRELRVLAGWRASLNSRCKPSRDWLNELRLKRTHLKIYS